MDKDFYVNEFGEIVRAQNHKEADEKKLMDEYYQLAYEIHHRSRPTTDPEKIARYEELKRVLKIDEQAQGNAFNKAKEKIRAMAMAQGKNNNPLKMAILKQQNKEND
ncbi:MAG: hypothetical protein IJX89_04555 [Alphaproteobacteria bacterium]|nr:hypothetical protein [Alphaproteobacteria bacterium]